MSGTATKKTFNAVYSVKGGCGKTAFSVFLAYYLAKSKQSDESKVCLIDTDILGSSMLNTFRVLKNDKNEDILDLLRNSHYRFINEIVNVDRLAKYKEFLIDLKDLENLGRQDDALQEAQSVNKDVGFYIAFSSPKSGDIDRYRQNSAHEYIPNVSHNLFRVSFKAFINDEVCFNDIEDLVYDLPPNADGFSGTVFDSIFGKDNKKDKIGLDSDRRNLFYIMNLDSGHILPAIREISSMLSQSDMEVPTNIFLVINNMFKSDDFPEVAEERRKKIIDEINRTMSSVTDYQRIYCLFFPYYENYMQAVVGNGCEGILKAGLDHVFAIDETIEIYDIDGTMLHNSADADQTLYKIITGE